MQQYNLIYKFSNRFYSFNNCSRNILLFNNYLNCNTIKVTYCSISNINNKNVLQVLNETKDKLKQSENELISNSIELESKLLVSHVLKLDNNSNQDYQLFNKKTQTRILTDNEYSLLQSFINRRLNNEPISYIVGYRYFWKHKFYCNNSTLIPRPDSETIIEKIIEHSNNDKNLKIKRILDLGTGTGCLLLSVLDEFKDSTGIGIDKSIEALKIANLNSIELGLNKRVKFLNLDWNLDQQEQEQEQQPPKIIKELLKNNNNEAFDLIISNPPYISIDEFKTLNTTVCKFEPSTALISNDNGLFDYKSIASLIDKYSNSILSDNGIIVFEIGKGQENDIKNIMENNFNFKFISDKKDLNSIIRCLVFSKKKK